MKNFILFGVIALLALYILKGCNQGGATSEEVIIVKTDTLREYLPGVSDTVYFTKERVIYKELPTVEVSVTIDSVKTFKTTINDSLIIGEITTKLKGDFKGVSFSYVPKFPKYITRVDTFNQFVKTEIERPRWSLSAGAVLGSNGTFFSVAPSLLITTPKGSGVHVGYDFLNKSYYLGGFIKLKRPKLPF